MKKRKKIRGILALTMVFSLLVSTPLFNTFNQYNYSYASSEISAEVEALISRIDSLPTKDDLGEQYVQEVKSLMEMYTNLPMSQKMYVSNYEKLNESYKKFFKEGFITSEEDLEVKQYEQKAERQSRKKASGTVESQVTEYVFKMESDQKATIMVRYTSDQNNDGIFEKPDRVVLVSPSAKSYPVTNTSIEMEDGESIKAQLTWAPAFLQIDLEKAEPGTWSVETSVPVTISQQAYAGDVSEIQAEQLDNKEGSKDDETDNKNKDTSSNSEKEESESAEDYVDDDEHNAVEESKEGSKSMGILGIAAIVGVFAFLKIRKSGGLGKGGSNKEEKKEEMSDEDILEQMKSFMREDNEKEEDNYGTHADYGTSDYEDNFDDYDEGDTSLLAKFEEDADKYYNSQSYKDPYEDYNNIQRDDNNSDSDDSADNFFDLI